MTLGSSLATGSSALNSPVWSLVVGDLVVSRCDDGLLEAEYALFDRSDILLSSGVHEEGYLTRASVARSRLCESLVTPDLVHDAFAAMRGRHIRPLARSSAVRDLVDKLGPYEAFEGGRFMAGLGRYCGVWLDLDALAAACPLRDASVLFQALHLVLVLEEFTGDTPVRLVTSQPGIDSATGGRTWRRVDLSPAQRLPRVLREMPAPPRAFAARSDEAEVREEILRNLGARANAAPHAQPRLRTLAAAIARTGSIAPPAHPPDSEPSTKRMSSGAPNRPDSEPPPNPLAARTGSSSDVGKPRESPPPTMRMLAWPLARQEATSTYAANVARTSRPAMGSPTLTFPHAHAVTQPPDARSVAQSLSAELERSGFVPDRAILAARAWLEAGQPGLARHFAQLAIDDPATSEDQRILALQILQTTPWVPDPRHTPPTETFQPAGATVEPERRLHTTPLGRAQPAWGERIETPPATPQPYPQGTGAAPSPYVQQQGPLPDGRPGGPTGSGATHTAIVVSNLGSGSQRENTPIHASRLVDPRLVLLMEPNSPRAAGYRALRDGLLASKLPHLIAVSSSAAHEGKTTCAINLALALCENASTRVLLMEGNFLAPSLGTIFHVGAAPGYNPQGDFPSLSPYRIVPLMPNLHVAAFVQAIGQSPPEFSSRWFDMVIGHFSGADYDHVVIDAASLDGSHDASHIVRGADGTLLAVRSRSTTARSLRRAAQQIPPGRALGAVLMDVES